ncbi:MAG TPA: GNAT family N-acetyltransferase [Acidobacteriaceae bacterium]|nr:GNAT family N-acetyltransferase [Acidobacteriaceae bacterium]
MTEKILYRLEPLGKHHDRAEFTCGVASLDTYLKTQASQDMRRKANAVFVLVPKDSPGRIAGYFTLCAFGLAPGPIPDAARRHLPRYPLVSATLIGRLAVSTAFQGRGLGPLLLAEALRKAYENASVVGSSMVVVDAISDRAVLFYEAHGFIRLPESMRLVLPMRTISEIMTEPR